MGVFFVRWCYCIHLSKILFDFYFTYNLFNSTTYRSLINQHFRAKFYFSTPLFKSTFTEPNTWVILPTSPKRFNAIL